MARKRNFRVDTVTDAVKHLLVSAGTDLASELFMALETNHLGVVEIKKRGIDPEAYTTAYQFAIDYMLSKLLSKWKGLRLPGVNPANNATRKWVTSERENQVTNRRLRTLVRNPSSIDGGDFANAVIMTASRKITEVLGTFSYDKVLSECKWGPGSTVDVSRSAGPDRKMTPPFSVTHGAKPFFRALLEGDICWGRYVLEQDVVGPFSFLDEHWFTVVNHAEYLTVDKDAECDRGIEPQPTGNGFLQQGVGKYIRRRMKRFGIDLDDQSTNQKLAKYGWQFGLSTLDLRSASDSVCTELVYQLFPLDWARYLDAIRTRTTKVRGQLVRIEKFSAMGNAFTFELETLVFWALGWATAHLRGEYPLIWVYGDDIICTETCAPDLIKVLAICGFQTNEEKSFIAGKFRESCGKHYWCGIDVTPLYLKKTDDSLAEQVRFANRLVRWSLRVTGLWRSSLTSSAWRHLYDGVSGSRRPAIPIGSMSDEGFLVPRDWLGKFCPSNGYSCQVLVTRTRLRTARRGALYPYKLRVLKYSNPDPKGQESVGLGASSYRLEVRSIFLSQVTGDESEYVDPRD